MSSNLKSGEFFGKVPGKRKTGVLTLSEIVHSGRINLPAHEHEAASFTLLLEGSYSERFGSRAFDYRPSTVWWHPPGFFHKDEIGLGGGRFFTVEIGSGKIPGFTGIEKIPSVFSERASRLSVLARRLYGELHSWTDLSALTAESLTLEMLSLAMDERSRELIPPQWLRRVFERICDAVLEPVSVGVLAAETNVHPVYLASVFRKFFGESIGEFVQRQRIELSKRLIARGDLPLAGIAVDAGFSDQSHFNRIFKRYSGVTPGEFRRQIRR